MQEFLYHMMITFPRPENQKASTYYYVTVVPFKVSFQLILNPHISPPSFFFFNIKHKSNKDSHPILPSALRILADDGFKAF